MPINYQPSTINPTILRARVVVPIRRAAIEDGAVIVSRGRIQAVGRWRDLKKKSPNAVTDLGEVALLPGLVNAHCHLDYTHMAGLFPPRRSFCDWLKLIVTEKASWTYSDFAKSWLEGARMLVRTGTTTVADIESVPELLPDVWDATPLRVFSFLEMTGVRNRRDPALIVADAMEKIASLKSDRCVVGLSPHAPYSTMPALLKKTASVARKQKWRVMTHVAESAAEFEMFRRGSGEMFAWLARNERDMSDCKGASPVGHLATAKLLGPNLLATHANYLAPGDIELLARRRVSVVHCPRSHDYFDHKRFPFAALSEVGVNICLGTDSLATVRKSRGQEVELNLFDEMQLFAAKNPDVGPEQILRMTTTNGARALGLNRQVGEISAGAHADLIAVPFSEKAENVCDAVIHHAGPVSASMVGGGWALKP